MHASVKTNSENRDGGIRTRDPLNPIQVRYRAALRPVRVATTPSQPNNQRRSPNLTDHPPPNNRPCRPFCPTLSPGISRQCQIALGRTGRHDALWNQKKPHELNRRNGSNATEYAESPTRKCTNSTNDITLACQQPTPTPLQSLLPTPVPLTGSNPIDTLWIAIASGLVLLMTPALALFYGGLVRSKSILNTMMMSLASFGVVGVPWIILGYSLAFGSGNAVLGNLDHAFLLGVGLEAKGAIPHLLFMAYQGTFAFITAGLISGALVERMRFSAYLVFIAIWSVAIYAPIAHWVWGGGWLGAWGVLDFAGGTVVHIAAGTAAGIGAVVVGQRRDYGRQAFLPHNVPMMLTGTALLWFGWLGFNGGSALAVNGAMVVALVNTIIAPMATLAVWLTLDLWRTRHATAVGAGTGIVVGLVAITPACGFVSPLGALTIGAIAAIPSYCAIARRASTRLDDSLDVVGAHGVGGVMGALLTGVFATKAWGAPTNGLLYGDPSLLLKQAVGVLATITYAGIGTFVVLHLVALIRPLRVPVKDEAGGLDVSQHGEEGYSDGEGAMLVLQDSAA